MADPPKATERRTRTPLPRGGDGDGEKPSPMRNPRMRFLVIVLVLLALNYVTVALFAPGREEPVRVPYSPTFLAQVRDGNVERISSTGATVEGRFEKAVKYPPNGDGEASRAFETEIPLFANEEQLSQLLEDEDVVIEAEPINAGRGFLASLLLGFGPGHPADRAVRLPRPPHGGRGRADGRDRLLRALARARASRAASRR